MWKLFLVSILSFFPWHCLKTPLNHWKSGAQTYIWQILIDYSKHTVQEGARGFCLKANYPKGFNALIAYFVTRLNFRCAMISYFYVYTKRKMTLPVSVICICCTYIITWWAKPKIVDFIIKCDLTKMSVSTESHLLVIIINIWQAIFFY